MAQELHSLHVGLNLNSNSSFIRIVVLFLLRTDKCDCKAAEWLVCVDLMLYISTDTWGHSGALVPKDCY